jgi:hypothetical protein
MPRRNENAAFLAAVARRADEGVQRAPQRGEVPRAGGGGGGGAAAAAAAAHPPAADEPHDNITVLNDNDVLRKSFAGSV